MRTSHPATPAMLALALALDPQARACEQCVHPGVFSGSVGLYANTSVVCTATLPAVAAAIPLSFWDPPDQAPCGMAITATNPDTGGSVVATVVGRHALAVGDDILLTTAGLAGLAADADPDHVPAVVSWTFNG